jgi:threonine dehydratase
VTSLTRFPSPLHAGLLPDAQGKKVVVPLCGGNVDTPVLGRVLERGLAADGRLMRFDAVTSDRPGGINSLTTVIARVGASIKDIYHERAWLETSISMVRVRTVVEVSSRQQGLELLRALKEAGYAVDSLSSNYNMADVDALGPSSA